MKRIALLLLFLTLGKLLFAQQTTASCTIKTPNEFRKESCGSQQIHLVFESSCPVNDIEITIYNRWGNILYISNQLDHYWQAKEKNPGTYYYVMKGTFSNGSKIDLNGYFNVL